MSSSSIRLTPLGGLGNPNGAIWHLQQGRRGLMIDIGTDMAGEQKYFAGGLGWRQNKGINDLLELGTMPLYDVYREDLDPEDLL